MRCLRRPVARGLLAAALWCLPAAAQVPSLVPLDDVSETEPLAPVGVTLAAPEFFGNYAHVWKLDTGEQVMQYYGDFAVHVGERRLRSRDAVVWMQRCLWQGQSYYHFDVFLSRQAWIRDGAGTVTTGPTLFVTFNTSQPPQIAADVFTEVPSDQTPLYAEAAIVRARLLGRGAAATGPAEMQVIEPGSEPQVPRPRSRPIVRVRWKGDVVVDRERGIATLTREVYLSQGLLDSREFLELRADAAVLFLAPRQEQDSQARPPGEPGSPALEPIATEESAAGESILADLGGPGAGAVAGVYMRGDVVMSRGERMIRSPELYYDFQNNRALIMDPVMRAMVPDRNLPIYVRAVQARQLSASEYVASKARISTSEFFTPHVHLGAETVYLTDSTPRDASGRITGVQAGTYRAYHTTLNVEGVPIAYWPYSAGDFRTGEAGLRSLRVGYNDDFGASVESKWYLFNLLGLEKPQGVDALLLADYFSKRGPGVGLDVDYKRENSYGMFRSYYIHDTGEDDLGPFRDGTVENPDRGRITWRHRQFLPDGWELTLEGSYISDDHFLEEYFRREFETEKDQETLVYLKKQRDNWAFTALAQWRIMDFLTQTEHLPDLGFHWIGEPLGGLASLYHESRAGFVRYQPDERRWFSTFRPGDNDVESDLTARADTRNEIDFPLRLGNVNIVPWAMARAGYWDSSPRDGSLGRLLGQAGVRAGSQFWRLYDSAASELLDLNGVRHVIRPEATAWMAASNKDSFDLYPFDDGVEDIDDFHGASLALRQRWQTKRGGPGNWRLVDWIRFDLELNLFSGEPDLVDPIGRFYEHRPENSNPRSHVRADFMYRISDTMALLADMNYDLEDGRLSLANVSYVVEHSPRYSYALGLRRIEHTDSTLAGFGSNWRLNEKHTLALRAYYDVERSELEMFDVTIVRKFPRWYAGLTFELDEIEDSIGVSLSVWPEGAPGLALGNRRYSELSETTAVRPED